MLLSTAAVFDDADINLGKEYYKKVSWQVRHHVGDKERHNKPILRRELLL
jgi:hypothetical protein